MMADRPSDRLVNEGQLNWTFICVHFDVVTLLNNIIYSFDQRYYYTSIHDNYANWPAGMPCSVQGVAHNF